MHETDRVVLVGTGFGVWQGGRHQASARWTDVVRVRAFKRDELTTDLVCMAFVLRDGAEILVHEDLPGFEALLATAEAKLPGMQPRSGWWAAVTKPAFAPNATVVFERDAPRV